MVDPAPQNRTKRGLDVAVAADLGDLLHELSANKDTRPIIAQAIKKAKPDSPHAASFRDVDVDERIEAIRKENEDREIKRAQDAALARMNDQRNSLLTGGPDGSGRKYSEDDVKGIEALMQKKGITDYDDGATLYAATQPPVTKPEDRQTQHGATWEFPEWATFGKDPVRASRNLAHQVIDEYARKRA